jgi:hypothetical protein
MSKVVRSFPGPQERASRAYARAVRRGWLPWRCPDAGGPDPVLPPILITSTPFIIPIDMARRLRGGGST